MSKSALHLASILALATLVDEFDSPQSREDRAAMAQRRRKREEAATAQWKAEQDAIAAPYREARRLRNIQKMRKS
jgi:hypothetical protein